MSPVFLIGLLALAACTDRGPVTPPGAAARAIAISFNGSQTFAVDISPVTSNADPRIERALLRQGGTQGAQMKMQRQAAWSEPPVYAVVPSLPDGVVYTVIRDPASSTPRVIAFSEATMTDDQLYRSVGRLALDELREPSPTSVRTITMYADNHYEVEADGRVERHQVHDGASNESSPVKVRGPESSRVLREAAKGEVIALGHGAQGHTYRPSKQ